MNITVHAPYCNGPVRTDDGVECDCGIADRPAVAPVSPLVADIITAGMALTHDTTNRLVDSLTAQAADARAELAAVRDQVSALLRGDYMPTPGAITRALYPSRNLIDQYREDPR